jgi:hypothetical protein
VWSILSNDYTDVMCMCVYLLIACLSHQPGEINWQNQSVSLLYRVIEQGGALIFTALLVAASAVIIWLTSKVNPAFAAIFISVSNTILPTVMKVITSKEHHLTDSR